MKNNKLKIFFLIFSIISFKLYSLDYDSLNNFKYLIELDRAIKILKKVKAKLANQVDHIADLKRNKNQEQLQKFLELTDRKQHSKYTSDTIEQNIISLNIQDLLKIAQTYQSFEVHRLISCIIQLLEKMIKEIDSPDLQISLNFELQELKEYVQKFLKDDKKNKRKLQKLINRIR